MKYENLADSFSSFDTPWEGKTGMAVEDFITRNLIKSGTYDTENETLSLVKGDDSTIDITVSVQQPTYLYGIINYGVRVDGTVYNGNELLMQYRDGRKIELGIAIQSAADRSGKQSTVQKPFSVTIKFNNNTKVVSIYPVSHEYFKTEGGNLVLDFPEGVNAEDAVVWVDVTEFFKKSFKDKKFETSFRQADNEGVTQTYKNTLNTNITNEVINLTYSGEVIIRNTSIDLMYEPSSTDRNNYEIVGFIGDKPFKLNKGDTTISGLKPGLNQISAQAIHVSNPDIYTDWFTVDVICAEGLQDTVVAINGISGGISNNGVATLYEMTVYSPKMEEVELITYLEDGEPGDNPNPTNIVKQEILDPSAYNIETNSKTIEYKKYIEIDSNNASKYLLVRINGALYRFYIAYTMSGEQFCYSAYYKEMEVEAINTDYVYTKTYSTKYNFDQIGGYINNVFVTDAYATASQPANIRSTIEPSDGWHENEGRSYFKVSAQKDSIFTKPLNLGIESSASFTLEFGIKTYNVSDIDQPILTLGKLQIRPTQICWDLERLPDDTDLMFQSKYLARVSKFQEGVETHIVITVDSNWTMPEDVYYPNYLAENQTIFDNNYKDVKINLLRVYINGCIDREIKLTESELTALKKSALDINPTTSDVDFYLFRIYNNNSLNASEIIKNYISFLPNKTGQNSKEEIFAKNNILGDDGQISWEFCQGKLNTLLYVIPKDGRFPNRFWGGADGDAEEDIDKNKHVAMFINYADPAINAQYGGRLNHLRIKGQGSSAMRYLIWNVGAQMKKHKVNKQEVPSIFTPMGMLYPDSIPENYTAIESLKELKNCYHMPPYDGQVDTNAHTYKYKKMVGKVNYASSMQSHKQGACKLYDDAYKTMKALNSGGLKAVHEEHFLYFYIESNLSDDEVSELTWEQVLGMTDQIKFMGFQTWGPGKGDAAASGQDDDLTPEYLMLEGGENGDASVSFLVPWHALQRLSKKPGEAELTHTDLEKHPVINAEESLEAPWDKLLIYDESIVYEQKGAWDIDFGVEEVEEDTENGIMAGYFKFADGVHESLKRFRAFYDFVYMHDFTFVYCDSSVTAPDVLTWNTSKKYLITADKFSIDGELVKGHVKYDMYRYDKINNTWVPAGLYYDPATSKWDRLNIRNAFYGEEFTAQSNQQAFRKYVYDLFVKGIKEYVDTDDISFHQAFIKYLSGTDNRAKNTYYQIIGPVYKWVDEDAGIKEKIEAVSDYKIRFIGDDLDTILATDNNGLQSKAYNLIEDSYDEAYVDTWGDLGNIFLRMYDICFEEDIREKLKLIMDKAGMSSTAVNNKGTYFYKSFFKIQEDFPAIAYNHTARIYYENADIIKTVGQKAGYSFDYLHNGVNPIEQSHGSSLECERQFMKERVAYLAGYAKSGLDNTLNTTSGSGGGGVALRLLLEFEPYQDFYPVYDYGTSVGSYKEFGDLNEIEAATGTYEALQANSITRRYVAQKGKQYKKALIETTTAINQNLTQVNLFKTLSITGLNINTLEGNFDRAVSFEIDNNKISENEDIFGKNWPKLNITNNNAQLPVVQNLSLKNMTLGDTLDLSTYYKLQTLDLTGSTTSEIIFPQTGNLSSVIVPASVNTFRVYSNPGFNEESVSFENIENLETVYIDCSKCGTFDITDFCEKLRDCNRLKSVDLRNAKNLNISVDALQKLISCEHCSITGTINIITSIENPVNHDIKFSLKQDLVKLFGDIDSDSNETVFKYKPSTIINVSTVSEVYVFGTPGEYPGLFPLTVPAGNDVLIKDGKLDITYTMERYEGGAFTSIASLSKDGVMTLYKESDTVVTKVYAVVQTKTGPKKTLPEAIVRFSWKAPSLGEFAYADGSFSGAYDPNKTVVGLVYACDPADEVSGTVHILGKEYFGTPKYLGYTSDGVANDANSVESANMYRVGKYLTDKLGIVENTYSIVGAAQAPNYIKDGDKNSRVNITDYTDFTTNYFNGKADTAKYMVAASQVLQALLAKDGSTLINYIEQKEVELNGEKQTLYMPKNKAAFEYLIGTYLPSLPSEDTFLTDTDILSCILYPHFYSVYYYEPAIKTGEILDPQYAAGNWYAPSAAELARIVYYRGYSATGSNFIRDEENTALEAPISKEIANGKTPQTTPIFSLAAKSMTIPSVWTALLAVTSSGEMRRIGVNVATTEYTTLTNNVFFNWLYSWSSTSFYGWYHGYNPKGNTGVDGNSYGAENYWRARKQVGLPLVQYKYQKPVTE